MAKILSIETATRVCSVALHDSGQLIGSNELRVEKSHSGLLTVMIEQLIKNCGVSVKALDAVAVSQGPGSYTGLRIGTSTAKGLCYALGVPLIGVNTLEALAAQMQNLPLDVKFLCPMIDARRMEVYCMVLDRDLETVSPTSAVVVETHSFSRWSEQGRILYFGSGSGKCKTVLKGSNDVFKDDILPSAVTVGSMAIRRFECRKFEDLAYFEPFYLKDFRTTRPKKAGVIN